LTIDRVDGRCLSELDIAVPANDGEVDAAHVRSFVDCGAPLPDYEIEIRDEQGRSLADRHCGTLFVRGPSVMSGYVGDTAATREVLSPDGWLDTGDLGYRVDGHIVIVGRKKDLLIINGRNIRPQQLEYFAEQQPETTGAAAFSVPGPDGHETAVMVVQCHESQAARQAALIERLEARIREELGINCLIELVPPHTLPRTSSGKLSRSGARAGFLDRTERREGDGARARAAERLFSSHASDAA
jgi:fatty-acyl-CoA synthase